ncbi:hypothetical protein FDECE_10381 [Fusarium decemcellulare]|nr:hypothetical protein FDECE_10381 [Fusarium decemcellulare]
MELSSRPCEGVLYLTLQAGVSSPPPPPPLPRPPHRFPRLQLPYHQAPPATPYLTSPTTGFDFTPTLLHPRRRRRAAPRLVSQLLPLSLFFFVSASLFVLQPRVLSGPRRLVPHLFTATDLLLPPPPPSPQSELGGLSLGRHANTSPYSLSSLPRSRLLPSACPIINLPWPIAIDTFTVVAAAAALVPAGADADRCEHPSTSVGHSAPSGHSNLISLEFGGGPVYHDVLDCSS